jgi:hypothetical protein
MNGVRLMTACNSAHAAGLILERLHIHQNRDPRPIGPFDHKFSADHALAASHGAADRRGIELKRSPIGPIAPERGAVLLARIAERRGPAP